MTQAITLMQLNYYNAFNMGLPLKLAHKPLLVQNATVYCLIGPRHYNHKIPILKPKIGAKASYELVADRFSGAIQSACYYV